MKKTLHLFFFFILSFHSFSKDPFFHQPNPFNRNYIIVIECEFVYCMDVCTLHGRFENGTEVEYIILEEAMPPDFLISDSGSVALNPRYYHKMFEIKLGKETIVTSQGEQVTEAIVEMIPWGFEISEEESVNEEGFEFGLDIDTLAMESELHELDSAANVFPPLALHVEHQVTIMDVICPDLCSLWMMDQEDRTYQYTVHPSALPKVIMTEDNGFGAELKAEYAGYKAAITIENTEWFDPSTGESYSGEMITSFRLIGE